MRSSWVGIVGTVLAAVLVFVIPIVVSEYEAWFGEPPPRLVLIGLVLLGMLVAAGIAYWTQRGIRAELIKNIKAHKQELDRKMRLLVEDHIEFILRDNVLERLAIPERARAFIYLMDKESGMLLVAFEFGMKRSDDRRLRFEPLRGWAGDVWDRKQQIYYDLAKHDQDEIQERWKFTEGQFKAIQQAGVQSVLYTPILHPHDSDMIVGVLGVDSTKPLSETHFNRSKIQEEVAIIARALGMFLVDAM